MNLTQKQRIAIHTVFILSYLVGMAFEASNTVSLILRAVGGLSICFYVVGESLRYALKKLFAFNWSTSWGEVAFDFLLSFSYFMCVSIILSLQYILNSINLILAMILVIAVSDIAGLKFGNSKKLEKGRIAGNRRDLWPIITVLLFGLSLALLFRSGFSWPSMPGWDVYTYLGGSNWVFFRHGTTNIFPTTPGSFFPSSYLFQILVASTAIVIGVEPYSIFWHAPFFTISFYGLLVYGGSYLLNRERWQSLVAALIALTICGGEYFLGPHYFLPSTISILLFLLLLITILDFSGKGRLPTIIICSFLLIYYAFYYYSLIITFPIFLFLLIRKRPLKSRLYRSSIPIFVTSLIIMILLSWAGGSILSEHTYSLDIKAAMISGTYPDLVWFLFLLGGLITVFQRVNHSSDDKNLAMLVYTISLLVIYFLPPQSLGRTEIVLRGLFAIIASFPFTWMQNAFSSFLAVRRKAALLFHRCKVPLKKLPWLLSCVILFLSTFILAQPYGFYASNVSNLSNISEDEYLAAEWINRNFPSDIYILTDPSTGYILRGLTLQNSSTSFIIHGHTPSPRAVRRANLSNVIYNFFREQDPFKVHDYLERLPKSPDLIVITTRTSNWAGWGGVDSTFCAPSENLAYFPGMEKFSTPLFALLKDWETVRIYGLTDAEISLVWIDDSFSEGWYWYLDGAYKDYSSVTESGFLNVTVQAENPESAWTGLTKQLSNCSGATYVKIRYRIDVPAYVLEIVLWRSEGPWIIIHDLRQSQEWAEEIFTLTEEKASSFVKVGLIVWTRDMLIHTFEVDYVLLAKIEATP